VERLTHVIASLPQDNLPHRIDISTPQAFKQRFNRLIEKVLELIHQCPHGHINAQVCETLLPIINDQHLVRSLTAYCTFVHGDLSADNILIAPDGTLHIIDWQRMIYGAPLIDQYTFLSSMGVHPEDHLPPQAGIIACLERIDWFTDTALYWYPAFQEGYTASIAELIQNLLPIYQKFCSKE
jgi:thiamine kinase-like enzyme